MTTSPEENRAAHRARREEELRAKGGPKAVASGWWDAARAVAVRHDRDGDRAAWDRLARLLETFCETDVPQIGPRPAGETA
ncbi:hypothetical protein ACFWA1_36045 [Streptomyces sp. NPDC060005]|uniref:hypothetical protein n=1 Tax=Streptomyces sp. NPDC060005 TaxID=3347034 RepID=UPI0036B4B185